MPEVFAPKEIPVIKKSGLVLVVVLCASLLSACDCDGDCDAGSASSGVSAIAPATPTPVVIPTPVTPVVPVTPPAAARCADSRFCKIGSDGELLDDSATSWSCVRETINGGVNYWEVKSDDSGLRDKDWTYAKAGAAGACGGTLTTCSPEAYVAAVNTPTTNRPCGPARACRLPTHAELIYLALPAEAFPQPDDNAKRSTVTRSYAPVPAFFPDVISSGFYFNSSDARQVNYSAVIPAGSAFNNVSDEGMAPSAGPELAGHVRLICN